MGIIRLLNDMEECVDKDFCLCYYLPHPVIPRLFRYRNHHKAVRGSCMPKQQKIEYRQIEAGYEFPPASYKLDSSMVAAYLKATGETSRLFQHTGLVPPMAIAACAMAALSERISIPPGTIHVSQKIEFIEWVCLKIKEQITIILFLKTLLMK